MAAWRSAHVLYAGSEQLFIKEYFDQNPISQLGIIVTRNKVAIKLTELSGTPLRPGCGDDDLGNTTDTDCPGWVTDEVGTPSHHMEKLRDQITTEDVPSFQNALEMARQSLPYVLRCCRRWVGVCGGERGTAHAPDEW